MSKLVGRPVVVKEDRHFVTALARGLELLACFRSGDKMLGNQELAERSKLPKSTVSRLTYTLTKLGYLQFDDESGKYRLGTATLSLGSAMLSRLDVRQLARPAMQQLADFSHSMVSLGMRDRLSMIYIENCRSQAALTLSLDVGSRIPLVSTAMGRAYLAVAPQGERNDLLARARELDEQGWPVLQESVQRALDEYREFGCCTSIGDWQPGVNAIAIAFRPPDGSTPVSINCGGPAFTLSADFLVQEVRPRLIELVEQLRRAMAT
ncbi:IclR family transcriptional regulator [Actimicrobium sp. CCI2.3]|uniref:IclR family transcriptional regulator n=1 Tax=Actimicrobium sp. CCI2.3 TaxID=3048616 RepID=UPI002AB4639E|nr:IclR family transcriptional regulator [Actimicrobium sp. CCI2.3]MDY7575997.1 IclR family transcriptional regulator [Actimicrobium sp. CCI2.3]MEB0023310.1 IclR family transcriptional regulator [Actimicrobium sp. CCI2.3]